MATLISNELITEINTKIVPNLQGVLPMETVTLDNIVDFGTAMSALEASQLKDYTNTFITSIITTEWNVAEVELLKLPIFKDALRYGAIKQSIYRNGVTNAEESKAFTLVNGGTYDLETYHGFDFDVKVNDKDTSFRLVYSVPNSLYESAFTNIAPLVAYIHECVTQDMNEKANGLLHACVLGFIVAKADKRVKLVTLYNEFKGIDSASALEWDDITADSEKLRDFEAFAKGAIVNGRVGMRSRSKKYNDGTVLASTPNSRNNLLVLSQFDELMKNYGYANTFNAENVKLPEHDTIDFWQNPSDETIPDFDVISNVDVNYGIDSEDDTPVHFDIEHVVAIAYDDRAMSVMVAPNKVTSSYNGNGDFTTFYDYYTSRQNIETRANGIVFTLE